MQVYVEGRYVGEINLNVPPGQRQLVIHEAEPAFGSVSDLALMDSVTIRRREFTIEIRRLDHKLSDLELHSGDAGQAAIRAVRKSHRLPEGLSPDIWKDFNSGDVHFRWRWPTLRLSIEEYEWLFDQPSFVPA